LNKLIYSVCNPVEAALVERALDWPGVSSLRPVLEGTGLTAKRPAHFFRPEGPMPEVATLTFVRPREFGEISERTWTALITARVKEREQKLRMERAARGERTVGWRAVLKQRCSARPMRVDSRRKMRP